MSKGFPARAPQAEGAAVDPLADLAQPLEVVGEGEAAAQHPVAPADGLGALQVGVTRHDVVDLGLRALRDDAQEALEEALELVELVAQRMSVAICSLRPRPVCSLPAMSLPMISPRRRSF